MQCVDVGPVAALQRTAVAYPDQTSIVYGDVSLTASEIVMRTRALAAILTAGGTQRGDRVGLIARNSPLAFDCYLACANIGAVYVPLNFRLAPDEVRTIVADSGMQTLIAEPEFAAMLTLADPPAAERCVVVDNDAVAGDVEPSSLASWLRLSQELAAAPAGLPAIELGEHDLAALVYTSGTTGKPKGVRLTHGNIWWAWRNTDDALATGLHDVTLAVTPLAHIGAFNAFALRTLVRGGTVVILRRFEAGDVLRTLEKHHVTTMFAVPSLYRALADHPDFTTTDLHALAVPLVGGACAPASLIDDYRARGVALLHSWGMTETAGGGTYLPPDRAADHVTSVGVAMPYTRIKLVDRITRVEITVEGQVGEVLVAGPNVTDGYWNNPRCTARAIVDGWLHTGDCAERDSEGFYILAGRIRDMIISGGENIYSAEIENALRDHPAVAQIAAIGVPDTRWGESVMVFVVPTAGSRPTLEELRTFAATRLARFKLPKRLRLLDTLPIGRTGKVDTAALRTLEDLGPVPPALSNCT